MRYIILFGAMLSDIVLLIVLIIVWNQLPVWISIIATFLAYQAWKESGGFMAWKPKWIKGFLENAKELNL